MTRPHRYLPLFLLLAGLTALSGCATQTTGPSDGIVSSREVTADGTWLTFPNGCKLLDPAKRVPEDAKVIWSGRCVNGYAEGTGNLNQTWDNDRNWTRSEANLVQGRRNGVWTAENSNGSKQVRSYKDGKLNGLVAQLNPNGTYQEYFFVDNRRIMSWLVAYSYADGRWCSGGCKDRGPSSNYVIVVRAEGKEPMTQSCGTDALACRQKVRSIVKETLRLVAERAKQPASNSPSP